MATLSETPHRHLDLYEVLGIEKDATDDAIKRAYRKLALRYHPDKNLDGDPEKTERFKDINYAHSVLSNPSKRQVYDAYGDMGLRMMEQVGENTMLFALKPWVKWVFLGVGCLTCCCFGGCCCCMFFCNCCCNFCCGKYAQENTQYFDETEQTEQNLRDDSPITTQPTSSYQSTTTASPENNV